MSPNLTERNRKNAESSTGPKTDQGKTRSSQNSLKTGLYSVTALLPNEDREEYLAHADSYLVDLKAQGPVQSDIVKIISDNAWRLRRIRGLEATQSQRVSDLMKHLANHGGSESLNERYAAELRSLETLGRLDQRAQNCMFKAIKQLKDLQKEASQQPQTTSGQTKSGFVPNSKYSTGAAAGSEHEPNLKNRSNPPSTDASDGQIQAA